MQERFPAKKRGQGIEHLTVSRNLSGLLRDRILQDRSVLCLCPESQCVPPCAAIFFFCCCCVVRPVFALVVAELREGDPRICWKASWKQMLVQGHNLRLLDEAREGRHQQRPAPETQDSQHSETKKEPQTPKIARTVPKNFLNGSRALPNETRVLRLSKSSPKSSAKSLSQKFFGVPFLSLKHVLNQHRRFFPENVMVRKDVGFILWKYASVLDSWGLIQKIGGSCRGATRGAQ